MKIRRMMISRRPEVAVSSILYFSPLIIILLFTSHPTFTRASDITGINIPNTISGTMGDDKILGRDGKDN